MPGEASPRTDLPTEEDRLLAWLRRRGGRAATLLGDDAALLAAPRDLAITLDHQIEGVHFPAGLDPAVAARRVLAVNLSDLAAVGAQPLHAFLGLATPPAFHRRRFLAAFLAACRRHGVRLAGGDLARAPVPSFVVTLTGGKPPGHRGVARGPARAGDPLWVGGTLGESAAGRLLLAAGARLTAGRVRLPPRLRRWPARLRRAAARAVRRHLLPAPQLALGRWLGRRPRAAAIDVSDGLALDLHRLCRASGVGAELRRDDLPLPQGLSEVAARLGTDALELALHGGEDYVLLFSLPPRAAPPPQPGCRAIGTLTARRGLRLRDGSRAHPLPARGWDHLAAPPVGSTR